MGILPTFQALAQAQERGLDLVEVAPGASPPVVRFLDYGKFKYEQAKRRNEGRKRQKNAVLREVTMKPKSRSARHRLQDPHRAEVARRGRQAQDHRHVSGTRDHASRDRTGAHRTSDASLGRARHSPCWSRSRIGMEGRFMSVIVAEDKVKAAALERERARAGEPDTPESRPAPAAADAATDGPTPSDNGAAGTDEVAEASPDAVGSGSP